MMDCLECSHGTCDAKKFVENESYLHKKAKDVVCEWLNGAEGADEYARLEPFVWRHQSGRSVLQEYPICKVDDRNSWEMVWDELNGSWDGYVPSYQECIKKFNAPPLAIIDIVIMHKGAPIYAIEICHKNPLSQEKKEKLKSFGIDEVYEIDASWVMRQIRPPHKIKCNVHKL